MMFQSSPAPEGGRYVAVSTGVTYELLFQSSPAPEGGRYLATESRRYTGNCFNPRPPRKAGATAGEVLPALDDHMFQSSPAPEGGRYPCHMPPPL